MRILYFDAFSGVSGDMTVGALLALGLDGKRLESELAALRLKGYRLRVSRKTVNGIRAHKFDVLLDAPPAKRSGHRHRSFRDIRALIERSRLDPRVQERSIAIFTKLAAAEGRVHGVAPDKVEFHEVGAIDSIVDIVGTAIGLTELGVEAVYASALPLGSGTVRTRHGVIPVPAPATVDLLRGFPVRFGDGTGELVTPTGAAIVASLATAGEPLPPLRIEAVGYGAGSRTLEDRPNVLRLLLATAQARAGRDEMVLIETNIDDSSPELYGYVMERLFEAGARDVWLTAAQMKKNRPGTVLHVLAEPGQRDPIAAIVLSETSAIGARFTPVQRMVLERQSVAVETEFGRVSVKLSKAPNGSVNIAPEYEECARLARKRKVPLKVVYQAAAAAARQRL